jgi:hypothetical protein
MIKLKKNEFKAHICIFRPLLEEILKILEPYFEVDYLLPRTLMACLTLEQLPIVVRSGLIPPDITLASLCFHVRKKSQISKNSDKEMVNTIYKVTCSRRFRILAQKIEFGLFGLFRIKKKNIFVKNRGF